MDDPSMMLGALPAGNPDPNATPLDDPVTQMFIKSMGNSPAPQPAGPAAMGIPGGTVPPGNGSAGPATPSMPNASTAPVAVGNPASQPQPGGFKKLLMNIMYGAGEAMKKNVGLPTDQEIQAQDQADALKKSQMDLAQQRIQSQQQTDALKAQAQDMEDIAPQARALGATLPDGATMMVPRNQAGPMLKQIIANQPKNDANDIKQKGLNLNAAKLGYSVNPDGSMTPMDGASLSLMQQSGIAVNNAQIKLKAAQTDLQSNPDNPINKIKLKVAMANAARADESLRNQEQRTGIMRDALDFRKGQSNFGDPNDPHNPYAMLTPHGQTVLQETAPVKEQIVDLMKRMEDEGVDKQTTPGTLAKSRIKYAMGFGGPGDELGSDISNLSLAKVTATARAMKGQRGQRIWAEAEKHTPNLMLDSGWQIHNKLGTLLQMLDRTEQAAVTYERKGGVVPIPTPGTNAMPTIRRRGDTTPTTKTTGEKDGWE